MDDIERRREYLEERKFLAQLEIESYKSFDSSLLLVTTGAIALSVTYITSHSIGVCLDLAMVAWLGWISSIGFQLLSRLKSAQALSEAQKIIAEVYLDETKAYRTNEKSAEVGLLNILALASFAISSIIFLVFVYKSVSI